MLDQVQNWLTASDHALTQMGPGLTILLALLFGGGSVQLLKFPLAWLLRNDAVFVWTTRLFAAALTTFFAHYISNSLHWAVELGLGPTQIFVYHIGLQVIRHKYPWLEVSPFIGSVDPSEAAHKAAAERAASKAGAESGV